ncbi:hypothetical protein [Sulfitobacter sp. 20_GPM-1509m]|uniref:hypothetical protein n=1 Tax=Sulfitobacter sp. 20_GPM-1509m TaxID=1380367 RepID=UPI00048D6BEB|nr:hypothetical protein [Sulfitobacter sp. 20_GPM-1509m]
MSLRIKPGETLEWSVVDDSGDLTGTTIESAVSFGDFYYQLTVTEVDLSIGSYTISATSTEYFPPGRLNCDLKYTVSGTVTYSDTFSVYVDKRVTK